MSTKLRRIAEKAKAELKTRFNNLAHLLTPEFLKEIWRGVNKQGAAGIDRETAREFEANLDERVQDIVDRLRRKQYRAPIIRRVEIPKGEGKTRPLGITTMEDRLVQRAVGRILEAVYEPVFLDSSYGFRPGRSAHDALKALRSHIMGSKINWVYEADIRGYFDAIQHEWLQKMLAERVADPMIQRLIGKWLKAGVMANGVVLWNEEGTPQGGPISPILANVYLHYVLDLWFEKVVRPQCQGEAHIVRYADDFVVCFQSKGDAERFAQALPGRMAKFHLELAEEKTRLIEFGRYAKENQAKRGGKPETFNFLGFTHICGTDRRGRFTVIRKPSSKSMRRFLERTKEWLKANRHLPPATQQRVLRMRLEGLYQYFGLWHCAVSLDKARWAIQWTWGETLRRQSQRHRLTWDSLKRRPWFHLPRPRVLHPTV